jgi:hypothetical protein
MIVATEDDESTGKAITYFGVRRDLVTKGSDNVPANTGVQEEKHAIEA